ncbi:Asp23/Gls24 family envelope stress response protein [Actinacidiphila oryziradicis]|uniref:Asp23/Gls24 family envelope stress response protein n=1 Tax=Actinacidiphila oryziradicis TaxID=2571141 RepID=A0A4U0SNM0_9ACTN|nr:Asp23/Gls24 family envelope stress response protein [Actinacidiphila oryziradicis]
MPGAGPAGQPVQAGHLPPPAERGATVIPDRVVARVAARAARTAQAQWAGLSPDRRRGTGLPDASAATHGGSARLGLSLDLPYPIDIARVSQRIQCDVAERVTRLTGLRVAEVTLTVRRLVTGGRPDRGRVR